MSAQICAAPGAVSAAGGPTALATQTRLQAARLQAISPNVPPPASLTTGIPHPEQVMRQKEGYVRNLDDQLKGGASVLEQQVGAQRDEVRMQAEREKQAFNLRVDQQVRTQQMQIEHVYSQQVKELKKQAMRQRALLEQQALQLSFEYQDKKHEEEHMQKQYELHTEQRSLQERMHAAAQQMAAAAGAAPQHSSSTKMHPGSIVPMGTSIFSHMPVSQKNSYVPPVTHAQGWSSYTPPVGSHAMPTTSFAAAYPSMAPVPTYTMPGMPREPVAYA